jgi:hypothetical protein
MGFDKPTAEEEPTRSLNSGGFPDRENGLGGGAQFVGEKIRQFVRLGGCGSAIREGIDSSPKDVSLEASLGRVLPSRTVDGVADFEKRRKILATCPDQQGGFPRKRCRIEVLNNPDAVSTVIASEIASSGEALPPVEGSVSEGTRSSNTRAESQQEQDEGPQASHIALQFEHAPLGL